jgi:hypothetical protein
MSGAAQPLGDGDISEEKVQQLLALGGELDDLHYRLVYWRGVGGIHGPVC